MKDRFPLSSVFCENLSERKWIPRPLVVSSKQIKFNMVKFFKNQISESLGKVRKKLFGKLNLVVLVLALYSVPSMEAKEVTIEKTNVMCNEYKKLNDSIVFEMLLRKKVKEPHIVLAQAKIETGNYTSRLCRQGNNLFGIKLKGRYAHFKSVDECIDRYLDKIQYKYREGHETYYAFLKRIKYATNPNYINTVRRVEKEIRFDKTISKIR